MKFSHLPYDVSWDRQQHKPMIEVGRILDNPGSEWTNRFQQIWTQCFPTDLEKTLFRLSQIENPWKCKYTQYFLTEYFCRYQTGSAHCSAFFSSFIRDQGSRRVTTRRELAGFRLTKVNSNKSQGPLTTSNENENNQGERGQKQV